MDAGRGSRVDGRGWLIENRAELRDVDLDAGGGCEQRPWWEWWM